MQLPEILNQGDKPFCSAYAVAGAANFQLAAKGRKDRIDADCLYKKTIVGTGQGVNLRQVLQTGMKEGLPLIGGGFVGVTSFKRIFPAPAPIKEELEKGLPLPFTFLIADGMSFSEGIQPPDYILKWPLSTHSMVITGVDPVKKLFSIANSYGVQWKDKGYAHIEMQYFKAPFLVDCYSFTL